MHTIGSVCEVGEWNSIEPGLEQGWAQCCHVVCVVVQELLI